MLGEGLRAGLAHLGRTHRTVAYIEREAYAASVMVARMEEGSLDAAPVWPDLLTFDGRRFRGAVDCIAAGFPCQDLSLAGRRAGLDGARSGLFFNILDIADDCDAANLFLENVAGIASATASVVDEAEGALDERAAARVLGELADRGWNAEWLTLSASDVGASHGRERWFCWAWRQLDDADGDGSPEGSHGRRGDGARTDPAERREGAGKRRSILAHAKRPERRALSVGGTGGQQGHDGRRPEAHGGPGIENAVLGHADQQRTHRSGPPGQQAGCVESAQSSTCMADPTGHGRHQGRPEPGREQGRPDAAECGCAVADSDDREHDEQPGEVWPRDIGAKSRRREVRAGGHCEHVADASSPRQQGREQCGTCTDHRGGAQAHGPTEQLCRPFFAPGPADARWPSILREWPGLAPALDKTAQSGLRGVADGLASGMDDCRAQRLKCVGNGVVALCAATAFVMLARRAGFMTNQPPALVKTAQAATKPVAEMEII